MNSDFIEMQSHYSGMADSIIDQIDDAMPLWQKAQLRTASDVIRRHFAHRMALSDLCGEEIPLEEWLENWAAGRPPLDRRRSKMAVEKAVPIRAVCGGFNRNHALKSYIPVFIR